MDWQQVQFTHDDAVYEPQLLPPGAAGQTWSDIMPSVLFQTIITNQTDREQTYTFRAKKTRSTCSVMVEQACMISMDISVTLMTPCQILKANAAFRREMTHTSSESETTEEELTW